MEFIKNLFENLATKAGDFLPGVLGALLVLIVGLFLAGVIKRIIKAIFKRTTIDEKIAEKLNFKFSLADFIGKLVYYLVVIYTLLMVLNMMGITGVLAPLENMLDGFLSFLPNLIAGGIIAFAGYIIASLASEATGFVSSSVESMSEKIGWENPISLTNIIKQIVFILIFIPILIVAIDALKMEAISKPATEMFQTLLSAIPNIIAAALLLGIFYFVGKYVVAILRELLNNLNVDGLAKNVGLNNVIGEMSLVSVICNTIFFFLMFTGIISAVEKLEMSTVSEILNNVFNISGRVFFGLIILLAGSYISTLAGKALGSSETSAWMAPVVRFAIIGIFLAFGLHTMGIAPSIVNLAFGLTLGSVAVAFALAFGLGGREAAGKELERFFESLRKK